MIYERFLEVTLKWTIYVYICIYSVHYEELRKPL